MNKLMLAALVATMLTACTKVEQRTTSEGNQVAQADAPQEVCYHGVVYVNFDVGQEKWGGAKFNREGHVVTCSN